MARARSPTAFLVTLLLLGGALAGCIGQGEAPTTPPAGDTAAEAPLDWAARALPYGDGHDHWDPAHHQNLSTPNFQVLGWDPMITDLKGRTAGGHLCGDAATTKEGRRLAVSHSFTTDVAFVVVDVTDPTMPQTVGEYILENVHVYDVAMTLDGLHVVVGANSDTEGPDNPPAVPLNLTKGLLRVQPKFRDACTGETRAVGPEATIPLAPGAILVGIKDPANPTFEDFQPTPVLGPHSVSTAEVDGKQWALASITNLQHSGSYFSFYEVTNTPLGPKLVLLTTYQAPPPPDGAVPVINGHVDGTIQKHPLTGQILAYLANWDAGMLVLDVTNPRTPMLLDSWTDFEGGLGYLAGDDRGAIHGTLPIEGTWGGRHYTFAGQELVSRPKARPTGWIHVIDTTDPKNIEPVGRWTLPVDVEWDSALVFSTHYFDLVNRTLFVSMYHGGVWAVDVSNESDFANLRTIGVFLPDRVSPNPPGKDGAGDWAPTVLDVLPFPDGTLTIFDSLSGVYTVRFDETRPAPAPEPWAG
ncbi:MAG TPA: hypothetical protein VNZ52_11315 [Candidatus Thermoplasmatota archaeon]|nr:hypothetical protein [Candidatus Thermoplasmatota archaeon]